MVRKGRDLEILVALLEDSLGPSGIEINSPDYIPDKDTGENREVDVSLRGKIGSFEVLAIIECRKRKEIPDVRWIEEVDGKRKSVCAHKAMVVSSSGFTVPAQRKANSLNIELRTLDKIDAEGIKQWFNCRVGTQIITHANILDCIITLSDGKIMDAKGSDINAPIFLSQKDGSDKSLKDLWNMLPKPLLYANVPEDGSKHIMNIELTYYKENEEIPPHAIEELENLQVILNSERIDVSEIYISAELWCDVKKIPVSAKSYLKGNNAFVEIAEFEFEDKGKKYALNILNNPGSGKKELVIIPIGHDKGTKVDVVLTTTGNSLSK